MKEIPKSEWSEHYEGLTEKALKSVPKLREFNPTYIKEMIKSFWYHKVDLGGFLTPGTYNMNDYLKYFPMPEDLSGKTAIELGAAEGFFAFEMEKRGAKVVIAIDLFDNAIKHMEFLKKIFGYKTEVKKLDALESDLTPLGKFDIIWATNIMQHIKPGHDINDHPKEDFIKVLKLLVKDNGTIVCATDQQSDIDLLKEYFSNVKERSQFKMNGFKIRTQTKHELNTIVVEIKKPFDVPVPKFYYNNVFRKLRSICTKYF